jgi:hypothetical protein
VEKRTEEVLELVRLKKEDLFSGDSFYTRMDSDVHYFLARLIFFNNQYCQENIIDMEKHRWNFEMKGEKLSKRAFTVFENAGIKTFHDLVNFPSIELIKVNECGTKTILELKAYIIRVVKVFSFVRIPGLPFIKNFKIADEELFSVFYEKLKFDTEEWRKN